MSETTQSVGTDVTPRRSPGFRRRLPPPLSVAPRATVVGTMVTGLLALSAWVSLSAGVPLALRATGAVMSLVLAVVVPYAIARYTNGDFSPVLLFPVILSAIQNVLLLPVSRAVTDLTFQIVLSLNLLIAGVLIALGLLEHRHRMIPLMRYRTVLVAMSLVILVAAYTAAAPALGSDMVAAAASARNLTSLPLFLLLGLLWAHKAHVRGFASALVVLTVVVVVFGIFERFHPTFWLDADLAGLWEKKGLSVAPYGLPYNFVSSEQFGGEQLRRMASSFADPVHLGTFLFLGGMAAWYLRRYVVMGAAFAGCALAISKGALLGVIVFALVAATFYASRRAQALVVMMGAATSAAVVAFALRSSTGSLEAHAGGLLTAFLELPRAPLGHGIGQSGVLAQVLGEQQGNLPSGVVESGLGVVLGQMGIPGLLAFAALVVTLALELRRVEDRRTAVLGWSVMLAYLGNAAFNEVAMSPNSSAAYFILLGLLVGRRHVEPRPSMPGSRVEIVRSWRPHLPALMVTVTVTAVATFALLVSLPDYEATVRAKVESGTSRTIRVNDQGNARTISRPLLEDWQRVELAESLVTTAWSDPVLMDSGAIGGLRASSLETDGVVIADQADANVVFTVRGDSPATVSEGALRWSRATAKSVMAVSAAARPGLPEDRYTRLAVGNPRVVDLAVTLTTVARLVTLALLLGLSAALVWMFRRPGAPWSVALSRRSP